MENRSINFKIRILISFILGIIGLLITFLIIWDTPHGNTPEETKKVEVSINKTFQKEYDIDFQPDWSVIERIAEPLVYENERIAKAKALMHYSINPLPKRKSNLRLLFDDLWGEKYIISQQNWKIQTKLSRFLTSMGSAILSGIGVTISIFLILTLIPFLIFIIVPRCWSFLLKRIGELSRAIQGKNDL